MRALEALRIAHRPLLAAEGAWSVQGLYYMHQLCTRLVVGP